MDDVVQPYEVLDVEGLVQAELLVDLRDRRRAPVFPEDDERRIARAQVDEHEDADGDQERHRQHEQQAA